MAKNNLVYDPIQNSFTTYTPAETNFQLDNLPLMGPVSIPDFESISPSGVPIVKNNLAKRIVNNNQEYNKPINYEAVEQPVETNSKTSHNISNKHKKAMDFFTSKGLQPYQAAGIIGNFMLESNNLDTSAIGDNGTSYGLAQWHNERWDNLKKYAKSKNKDQSDFQTQLEFAWKELENNPKLLNALRSSKTSDEATDLILDIYERPKYPNQTRNQRRKNAKSLLS